MLCKDILYGFHFEIYNTSVCFFFILEDVPTVGGIPDAEFVVNKRVV